MHLYPSPPYKEHTSVNHFIILFVEHTCSTYFYTNLQYGIP